MGQPSADGGCAPDCTKNYIGRRERHLGNAHNYQGTLCVKKTNYHGTRIKKKLSRQTILKEIKYRGTPLKKLSMHILLKAKSQQGTFF